MADIPKISPGEMPVADDYNRLIDLASRNIPLRFVPLYSSRSGIVTGVLAGTLSYGGTADVTVYEGTAPSGGSATGEVLEDCWTWLLQSGWLLLSGYHVDVDRNTKKIIGCRECPVLDE